MYRFSAKHTLFATAALLLASGAFAAPTAVTNFSGATIGSVTSGLNTTFTLTLAPGNTGNSFVAGGTTYYFTAVNAFVITTPGASDPTLVGSLVNGSPWDAEYDLGNPFGDGDGYKTPGSGNGYASSSNFILASGATQPTASGSKASFGTFTFGNLPGNYSFVLDVFVPSGFLGGTGNTGRISFAPTVTPSADPVPEPGVIAFAAVNGLGLLGLMIRTRRRNLRSN